MTINNSTETIFKLLRIALSGSQEQITPSVNWQEVMDIAAQQGVLAICFDALEYLSAGQRPPMDELMDWLGQTSYSEEIYEHYKKTIGRLAKLYESNGIKMMLLKGYGLSMNYPKPCHRPSGDIDIYLYGEGAKADSIVNSKLDVPVKQNEDKHSTFSIDDILVENHSTFISDIVHPCLLKVEKFLEADAKRAVTMEIDNGSVIYLPSATSNAVFLPLHTAVHFFHGEASIRQLCDWAMFLTKHYNDVDWTAVEILAKEAGYYPFYCCLNGIIRDVLGVPKEYLPDWSTNQQLEKKVLNEIIKPNTDNNITLIAKVIRLFKGNWKHRLVFNENIIAFSIRQAKSYILIKGWREGKGIWERNRDK